MAHPVNSSSWDQRWDRGIDTVFSILSYDDMMMVPERWLVSKQTTTIKKVCAVAFHCFLVIATFAPLLFVKTWVTLVSLAFELRLPSRLNGVGRPKPPPKVEFDPETTLIFSRQNLENPPDLTIYKNLKNLWMEETPLRTPPILRENKQLQTLHIDGNRLETPPDLSQNENLTILNLSNNPLLSPPDVRHNRKLTRLVCSNIQLTEPFDVSSLSELEHLDLSGNRLKVAPDLSKCTKLKWLDLSGNELIEPPDLTKCLELEELRLSYNDLIHFPDIRKLRNLRSIYIQGNCIAWDRYTDPTVKRHISNYDDNPYNLDYKPYQRDKRIDPFSPRLYFHPLRKEANPLYCEMRQWRHDLRFHIALKAGISDRV